MPKEGSPQDASVEMPPLVVIVGPTAVGKTEISIEVARQIGGEIVSADSRLFYRGMDIGTAKPTPDQQRQVKHHLIDIANPNETISLAQFQHLAAAAITAIQEAGKIPILVGGSGQYVSAITEGWEPPAVAPNVALREALENLGAARGSKWLHKRLTHLDAVAAASIEPRNTRRIIRALEVIMTNGRRFSDLRSRRQVPYEVVKIGLSRSRKELFDRVDERIDSMFAQGLESETRNLLANGYRSDLSAMSAIGYAECIKVVEGALTVDEAKRSMKRATRVFVRRQANWFKDSDPRIRWFAASAPDVVAAIVRHLRTLLPVLRQADTPR
jgi:tRNA dimethylallyltransferase